MIKVELKMMVDSSLHLIIELTYGDGWIDDKDMHVYCLPVDDCRLGIAMLFEGQNAK